MNHLYEWIDRVWQWISAKVFVRFEFALPVDAVVRQYHEGKLVFVLTHGGIVEWLILSSWCRTQGMGAILVANRKRVLFFSKPLYFLQIVFRRRSYADLFLLEREKGPRLIFCPQGERKKAFSPTRVESLIAELFNRSGGGLSHWKCYPVVLFWRKFARGESRKLSEYLFGLSSSPNLIGKIWYLLRKRKDSVVKTLEPLAMAPERDEEFLSEGLADNEGLKLAKILRRRILVLVNQEMRVVLGPRYLSPVSVKESLLKSPEIQALINKLAAEEGVDRRKVMLRAYQYLDEIVANYQFRFIEVMYVLLTYVFTKIFDGLIWRREEIQTIRESMKGKPVVFVSAHRSHLDYLVIPYILFVEDLVPPSIAAGVNLSFWPVGYFLRMGGAFFIRRSFRGNALYTLCLKKYVEYLLQHRHNVKFFIEGTRSRSGKMLPPAFGILKMVTEVSHRGQVDDVLLVPVSICYDEILEQNSYTKELSGGKKEAESASALLRSRKHFRKNIGKVYVRFSSAISVRDVHAEAVSQGVDAKLELQKTAFQICKSINDVTPITPKAIVSTVFLSDRLSSVTLEDVLRLSTMLARYASQAGASLTVALDGEQFRRAVEQVVRNLQKSGILTMTEMIPRTFVCENRKRLILSFYKNNAIHCYCIPSLALLSLVRAIREENAENSAAQVYDRFVQHALELRNLVKFDFFFNPTQVFLNDLRRSFVYFVGFDAAESSRKNRDVVKGLASHFIDWDDTTVFLRALGDLLESYQTAFETVSNLGAERVDKKSFATRALKLGNQQLEAGNLIFAESISLQNYQSAFQLLDNLKALVADGDSGQYKASSDLKMVTHASALIGQYLALMEKDPHDLVLPR